MTSQIAILNPIGAAVASDTITSKNGVAQVAYGAKKLFDLGEKHQVVVLLSGTMSLNEVPCELLIKEWAKVLNEPLATVADYANNFKSWLAQGPEIMHSAATLRSVDRFLTDFYIGITSEVDKEVLWDWDDERTLQILDEKIEAKCQFLKTCDVIDGADFDKDLDFLDSIGMNLIEMIHGFFYQVEDLEDFVPRLLELAPLALGREFKMAEDTEFGFIGFGAQEHFSTIHRFSTRGVFGDVVRTTSESGLGTIKGRTESSVSTFARSNAIRALLMGAETGVVDELLTYFKNELEAHSETGELQFQPSELLKKIGGQLEEYQNSTYLQPALQEFATMNLLELGETAKFLVEIQALRIRLEHDKKTVGGLVEAVVIDREYGVRWISRLPQPTPHY